jgi:hypothetical protein
MAGLDVIFPFLPSTWPHPTVRIPLKNLKSLQCRRDIGACSAVQRLSTKQSLRQLIVKGKLGARALQLGWVVAIPVILCKTGAIIVDFVESIVRNQRAADGMKG